MTTKLVELYDGLLVDVEAHEDEVRLNSVGRSLFPAKCIVIS